MATEEKNRTAELAKSNQALLTYLKGVSAQLEATAGDEKAIRAFAENMKSYVESMASSVELGKEQPAAPAAPKPTPKAPTAT